MSDNQPPEKPAYKPLLDKDGKPIKNQFGHVLSAKLTKSEQKQIDQCIADGVSQKATAERLGTTIGRVREYLEKGKSVERIALLALTKNLVAHSAAQAAQLEALTAIVAKLETRVSDMQTLLRQVNVNARRQKIGRAKVEKEKRSQREELTRLRQDIWKRTGKRSD